MPVKTRPRSANLKIATDAATRSIELARLEAGERRKILGHLERLREDTLRKIKRWNLDGVPGGSAKLRRASKLVRDIDASVKAGYKRMRSTLSSGLARLAKLEKDGLVSSMNKVMGADLWSSSLDLGQMRSLARNSVVLGGPTRDWWATQSKAARNRFATQIRLGAAQGETNEQITRRVLGQSTGKTKNVVVRGKRKRVPVFTGGAIQVSENEARTLVRTSVQNVSNQTQKRVYEENSELLRGLAAIVTFDGRTSAPCISRAGGAWDFETGKPLPESATREKFPGYPPWHPNCRTVLAALTKSWDRLIDETTDTELRDSLDEMSTAAKASMDGEIPEALGFDGWLRQVGEARASKHLGPTRFRLWKEKRITLQQLIDQSGRPLTTEQLSKIRKPRPFPPLKPPAKTPSLVSAQLESGEVVTRAVAAPPAPPVVKPKTPRMAATPLEPEIEGAFVGFGIDDAEAAKVILRKRFPALKTVDVQTMDTDALREVASSLLRWGEQQPFSVRRRLTGIEMRNLGKKTYAAAKQTGEKASLVLNSRFFARGKRAKLSRSIGRMHETGFLAGDSLEYVVTHEMGHVLHGGIFGLAEANSTLVAAPARRAWRWLLKNRLVLGQEKTLSRYALQDAFENFAEAHAKVLLTRFDDLPNPWLKSFATALREGYEAEKLAVPRNLLPGKVAKKIAKPAPPAPVVGQASPVLVDVQAATVDEFYDVLEAHGFTKLKRSVKWTSWDEDAAREAISALVKWGEANPALRGTITKIRVSSTLKGGVVSEWRPGTRELAFARNMFGPKNRQKLLRVLRKQRAAGVLDGDTVESLVLQELRGVPGSRVVGARPGVVLKPPVAPVPPTSPPAVTRALRAAEPDAPQIISTNVHKPRIDGNTSNRKAGPILKTKKEVRAWQAQEANVSLAERQLFEFWGTLGHEMIRDYQLGKPLFLRGKVADAAELLTRRVDVQAMTDFLKRSPKIRKTSYRGLQLDDAALSKLRPGAILDQEAHASWTTVEKTAKGFARDVHKMVHTIGKSRKRNKVILWMDKADMRRGVVPMGQFTTGEAEVILPAGRRLQIVEVRKRGSFTFVKLKEI